MGFELLEKRIASDDKERLAEEQRKRDAEDARPQREPGRLPRVFELLGETAQLPAEAAAPGVSSSVPWPESSRSQFDVYRVAGLRDVIHQLARYRSRHALIEPTINAVDPELLQRPHLPSEASPAAGRAMWRVAERRAATLYRHAVDAGEVAGDDPVVEEALQRCGGGEALPEHVRKQMEAELGVRLDRVRIHTDAVAQDAARAVRAQAFTVGEDIFFAANKFAPDTKAGQKLLAHELQHVVQAWQGRTTNGAGGVRVSDPNESLEREAESVAERIERAPTRTATPIARPQSRFAPAQGIAQRRAKAVAPISMAPAPRAQMLLRAAADNAPAGGKGAKGGKADGKFQLTTNVNRGRAAEQAFKKAHKVQKDDVKSAISSFSQHVHKAKSGPLEDMHRSLKSVKQADPKQAMHAAASHAKQHAKDHEHQAHEHAKKHGKHDNHHGHDKHGHDHHEQGDHAQAHEGVQFKPISNWDRFMPEPLPDQDARERKRILNLVKKKITEDRTESRKGFEVLRKQQISEAASVRSMTPGLVARVSGAQSAALGAVSAAEAAQAAAVQASVAAVQAQVRAQAAAMKGVVNGAHAAAVAQIQAATTAANTRLATGHAEALAQIDAATAMELVQVAMKFLATKAKITALGAAKGAEASGLANMSLPYDGDKLKAAKQAAEQVAEQYASAMPENAADAASQIGSEQPKTESQIREMADKQKQTVKEQYEKAKEAVKQSHESSMKSADALKTQTLALIDQTAATTSAQLSALGASQVAAIHSAGSSAKAGITKAGQSAIAGIQSGVSQAASGILSGAKGIVLGAKQVETPDPDHTEKAVKKQQAELSKGVQGIAGGLRKSAESTASSLAAQAAGAAKGMAATAAAAKASAQQMGDGAKQSMTQAAQGASQSLKQIAEGHKQTADQIAENGEQAFKALVDGTKDSFDKVNGKLQTGLDGAVSDLTGKFNQAVPTQERADILSEAGKAAAKVKNKPWWQKALAVVVSVIVTVVVTVALTAVLGPLGPIVAAVIAGAIAGALGKIAENLVLGEKWSSGVGEAALLGAISGGVAGGITAGAGKLATKLAASSGAFKGVGTAFENALVKEGTGLGAHAIRTGTGVVSDFGGDVASQLIVNHKYEFSLNNIVQSVAINSLTGSHKFIELNNRINSSGPGSKVKNWSDGIKTKISDALPGGSKASVDTGGHSEPGGHHDGPSGGHDQNAQSHKTPEAPPAHDTPAAKPASKPAEHPAPQQKPTHETKTTELGSDAQPQPKNEHGHGGTSGKHADVSTEGKHGGDGKGHDDAQSAKDDKDSSGEPKHEAKHDDGPAKTEDHAKGDEQTAKHDTEAKPKDEKPGSHEHGKGEHPAKADEHAKGEHGEHGKTAKGEHGEHGKGEHGDGKHAKGEHKAEHGDRKHAKGEHGGDAETHTKKGEGDGGGGEHADPDAALISELEALGYPNASPEARAAMIEKLAAGSKPGEHNVRDTEGNRRGLKDLEHLETHMSPEHRARFNQDLAARLKQNPEAVGNLEQEIKAVRQAEKAADAEANIKQGDFKDSQSGSLGSRERAKLPPEQQKVYDEAWSFYEKQGMRTTAIEGHLRGIDFSKPVEVITLKKGEIVQQTQAPGADQGNYYAPVGSKPGELGINPRGDVKSADGNQVVAHADKTTALYVVTEDVQVLKSTAGAINDTWSMHEIGAHPRAEDKAIPFKAEGGGTQYFTTSKPKFVPYHPKT